jgi:hypothetical protein
MTVVEAAVVAAPTGSKQKGRFSNRVKKLLRHANGKKTDPEDNVAQEMQRIRVKTTVSELQSDTYQEDDSLQGLLLGQEEFTHLLNETIGSIGSIGGVPSDESPEQVSMETDYVSLPLRPVTVVPVNLSPVHQKQELGDTSTSSTHSTASSSKEHPEVPIVEEEEEEVEREEVEERQTPDLDANSLTGDSVSLLTFDTLMNQQALEDLSYAGVVNVLGNMVDQQWRAMERTMSCDQSPPLGLGPVITETGSQTYAHDDEDNIIPYASADYHKAPTIEEARAATKDSKVSHLTSGGITTPSTGTLVISNSPRHKTKQQRRDGYSYSIDSMSTDQTGTVELPLETKAIPRSASEMPRKGVAGKSPSLRTRSLNDVSLLDMFERIYNDDFSDVNSVDSTTLAAESTLEVDEEEEEEDQMAGQMGFLCGATEKLCSGVSPALEEVGEEKFLDSVNNSIEEISECDLPAAPVVTPKRKGAKKASRKARSSAPDQAREGVTEEALEPSFEQTVESHEQVIKALRRFRYLGEKQSSTNLLGRFRREFPDLYRGLVREFGPQAVHDLARRRGDKKSKSPVEGRKMRGESPSPKSPKKTPPASPRMNPNPTASPGKRRSLFSRLSGKKTTVQAEAAPSESKTSTENTGAASKATGKENNSVPSPSRRRSTKKSQVESALSLDPIISPNTPPRTVRSARAGEEMFDPKSERAPASPTRAKHAKDSPGAAAMPPLDPRTTSLEGQAPSSNPSNPSTPDRSVVGLLRKGKRANVPRNMSSSARKVHFARTPMILQRLHKSKPSAPAEEDENEDVPFFKGTGASLKTSSWFDEGVDEEVVPIPIRTPDKKKRHVLMTQHEIPRTSSPVEPPRVYGEGNKEFEEFA